MVCIYVGMCTLPHMYSPPDHHPHRPLVNRRGHRFLRCLPAPSSEGAIWIRLGADLEAETVQVCQYDRPSTPRTGEVQRWKESDHPPPIRPIKTGGRDTTSHP